MSPISRWAWRALRRHHRRLEGRGVAHLGIAVAGGQRAGRAARRRTAQLERVRRQRHRSRSSRWSSGSSMRARLTLPPPMWVCMSMPPAITTMPCASMTGSAAAGCAGRAAAGDDAAVAHMHVLHGPVDAVGGVVEAAAAQGEGVGASGHAGRSSSPRTRPTTSATDGNVVCHEGLQAQGDAAVAAKQLAGRVDAGSRHGDEDVRGSRGTRRTHRPRALSPPSPDVPARPWAAGTAAGPGLGRRQELGREARHPQQTIHGAAASKRRAPKRCGSWSKPCACSAVRSGKPVSQVTTG